jgi:F0F1-type ATP synthase assembly protein I
MDKWVPALRLTGIGFYIAICIVGGTLLGWWLGDKQPLFMIIGLVAGLILAVYGVYRMIRSIINEQNKRENGS